MGGKYFFINVNNKCACLICNASIAVSKKCNVEHFMTMHKDFFVLKKALTILRGTLSYLNGLLNLHIETFGRTPWLGDQPNARPLLMQDNTTQKHADTCPCPKQDSNLQSQCLSGHRQCMP
jgi:hypothetical protein